jgi:hypothetical protein
MATKGRGDKQTARARGAKKSTTDAAEQRRTGRAHWPIVRFRLGEEPSDDLSAVTTPVECIAMMRTLAESAWKLAGRPLPTYDRRNIPARFFGPGTPRPDDDDA